MPEGLPLLKTVSEKILKDLVTPIRHIVVAVGPNPPLLLEKCFGHLTSQIAFGPAPPSWLGACR
eukprot:6397410-Pyramimonas_sp.AAC.1